MKQGLKKENLFDAGISLDKRAKPRFSESVPRTRVLIESFSLEDWPWLVNFSTKYRQAVPFYGIHPRQAASLPQGWEIKLGRYLKLMPSGIGRIGLMKPCSVDLKIQKEILRRQLELAAIFKKPVSIFCLRAWSHLFDIWDNLENFTSAVVVHVSEISSKNAEKIIKLGGYLAFNPLSLPGLDSETSDVFTRLPVERLLLETGFTFLGNSSRATEALHYELLDKSYMEAAKLRKVSQAELIEALWNNSAVFLKKQGES